MVLALLLAVGVYFCGLGSEFIPKNGDEYVYAHITRLTAASGDWLPLQSELHEMRNTKPPLLFWQGIASTHGGQHWRLWDLRWPNVTYTLLTAALAGLLAWRLSSQFLTGGLATLFYLGFFSTYRFGRPFLTNAPEIFWLFLPFVLLIWQGERAFASRWRVPLLLGGIIGVGLLYKSFVMLLPVGLCLAWWYADQRRYALRDFLLADLPRLLLTASVALMIFSLWFWLDPDPASIWREFVVGENAGKLDPQGDSYWHKLLWGTSSMGSLALGFLQNAAFLAPPVLALFILSWQQRRQLSTAERRLWMWVAVLFVVFCLPSQRSARYLLDAMPALAVLLALRVDNLPRRSLLGVQVLSAAALCLMSWIVWQLAIAEPELFGFWLVLVPVSAFAFCLLALALPQRWSASLAPISPLLVFLSLSLGVSPLDGPAGRFDSRAQSWVEGQQVGVPYNFNAKFEVYRFLLPGAGIVGYHEDEGLRCAELASKPWAFFIIEGPLGEAPPPCSESLLVGQRLKQRSRHSQAEIRAMLHGELFPHLFVREYLYRISPDQHTGQAPVPRQP